MIEYGMLIDGEWTTTEKSATVILPATEEPIATVPVGDIESVDAALVAARRAQPSWARLTGVERGDDGKHDLEHDLLKKTVYLPYRG